MPSQDSQGRKLLHIVSIVANLPITGVEGHYPTKLYLFPDTAETRDQFQPTFKGLG